MAGFGRSMCPLNIICPPVRTYIQTWSVCTYVQSWDYGHLFTLVRSDVTIADDNKLQFYLEQMYNINHFDKDEMLAWEKQPTATKMDYDAAKNYFEALVKAMDTYKMNAGGGEHRTQQVQVSQPAGQLRR
jgi:hypothetical protein